MNHIDYKVEGGKLLRIDVEMKDNIIKDIEIRGDFFVHPQSGLEKIEEELTGTEMGEVEKRVEKVVSSEQLHLVGFSSKDLAFALENAK